MKRPELNLEDYPKIYEDVKKAAENYRLISDSAIKDVDDAMNHAKKVLAHNDAIRKLYTIQIILELVILAGFCYMIIDKL